MTQNNNSQEAVNRRERAAAGCRANISSYFRRNPELTYFDRQEYAQNLAALHHFNVLDILPE